MIERLKRRDQEALQVLMERYGDDLLRTALLLLQDRQAAEEAVQDTFVTAYYKIGQLEHQDKLKGWLMRIVANRCRMRRRTAGWRRWFTYARVEPFLEDAAEPGPEAALLRQLRREGLADAIGRLTYPYREAVVLYYYTGLSVSELADQLGCSPNTVKSRLARARERLKHALEEAERDENREGND